MTIHKHESSTACNRDAAETLALDALQWILSDSGRAQRFLDLTGLSPESLRAAIANRALHAASLEFLLRHEPDLLAAAGVLDVAPESFADAHERLTA